MSEIAQLKDLPDISFIDNLTMKEVEELTKNGFSRSMQGATGQTPVIYPASAESYDAAWISNPAIR